MGLIWGTLLSALAVAGTILIAATARVVGDDVKVWLPWIAQRLIERAVSRLPEAERDRFKEEWWAHINELPGNLAKIYAAWGCLSAAKAMKHIALSGETTRLEEVTRRVIEVFGTTLLLLFVLPLMLLVSICIKLDSRGPVLSKQRRLGVDNRPFYLLKFRSMYVELPSRGPRVTRVGRIIRTLSLDELPQLLNVLRGEMSLVGPEPLPPPSAADASARGETPRLPRLHRLRPGITGWAQINSWTGGEAKLLADLYYSENRSLIFDLMIIVRALFAVLSRDSAASARAHGYLAPARHSWRPKTSLGLFLYLFCACLVSLVLAISCLIALILAIAFLIDLILAIACLLGLVSAIAPLIPAVIHFLGCL
jgi:lipopolysaccharide/colanic/teichoic acid biosynthesis glycosyltransferase